MNTTFLIQLNSILIQNQEILSADLDEELVMISLETDAYYALDAIGRRIWELISQPTMVADLCATLQEEYHVDATTCQQDVLELLNEMVEQGLITIVNER